MFIILKDGVLLNEDEMTRVKRRHVFANRLCRMPVSDITTLLNRAPLLVDLELSGCESIADYREVIQIFLKHKIPEAVTPDTEAERVLKALEFIDGCDKFVNKQGCISVAYFSEICRTLSTMLARKDLPLDRAVSDDRVVIDFRARIKNARHVVDALLAHVKAVIPESQYVKMGLSNLLKILDGKP